MCSHMPNFLNRLIEEGFNILIEDYKPYLREDLNIIVDWQQINPPDENVI